MNRYARQSPVIGEAGQARLSAARVLVVGAGGLGAPVLSYLVGAGVGFVRLVDPDCVDETNLHRQVLFGVADVGKAKVDVAARALRALNPDVVMEPVHAALGPGHARAMMEGVSLVIDCADSFAVSYVLSDAGFASRIPLISGSVIGRAGYVGGFCAGMPSLRAVFPDLPQRLGNCAEDGVLGSVVGVIGSLQADLAMKVLLGETNALGRLVTYDSERLRFGGFDFCNAEEPAFAPRFIGVNDLHTDDLVIDLRREDEGPSPPGAARVAVADVAAALKPAKRIALVCQSGQRSWTAANRIAGLTKAEIVLVAMGLETRGSLHTS